VGRSTETEPVIDTLAEEWDSIAVLGSSLASEEWDLPSECPGWRVRDVLAHLMGTERSLLGEAPPEALANPPDHVRNTTGATNEAWVSSRRHVPGFGLLAEFVEVTSQRLAELRSWPAERFEQLGPSPLGTVNYREFMNVRVLDCWVHEQDIRVATGRPGGRAGAPAETAIARIASAMGFVVGKRAQAPEGA